MLIGDDLMPRKVTSITSGVDNMYDILNPKG